MHYTADTELGVQNELRQDSVIRQDSTRVAAPPELHSLTMAAHVTALGVQTPPRVSIALLSQ